MLILDVVGPLGKNSSILKLQHKEIGLWELRMLDFELDRIGRASKGGQNGESGPPAVRWCTDELFSGRHVSILS